MQTVLVTGANGFVGSYVVKQLLEKNYNVIGVGRSEKYIRHYHPNYRYEVLDFTDKVMTTNVLDNIRPDVIVHSGAMSKPDDCEQNKEAAFLTNVTGTTYLLEEAARYGVQFIFLSTDFVFSGEDKGMYKENDIRNPVNFYGQTKVLAEDEVMKYEFNWAILRTVLVYGKALGQNESFIEMVVRSVKQGKELKIFDDQVRTPTYVEDLAKGIVAVVERKKGGIFHLSGKDAVTVYEAACLALRCNGLDTSRLLPIKEGELLAHAKRPKLTGFTIEKAQREISYEPLAFTEGLQKTFALSVSS